jgi:hypothetical protein
MSTMSMFSFVGAYVPASSSGIFAPVNSSGTFGRTPLPGHDIAMDFPMSALTTLPGLPKTLDVTRAGARLTLSAPTLEEWLSSRKDKRL